MPHTTAKRFPCSTTRAVSAKARLQQGRHVPQWCSDRLLYENLPAVFLRESWRAPQPQLQPHFDPEVRP